LNIALDLKFKIFDCLWNIIIYLRNLKYYMDRSSISGKAGRKGKTGGKDVVFES